MYRLLTLDRLNIHQKEKKKKFNFHLTLQLNINIPPAHFVQHFLSKLMYPPTQVPMQSCCVFQVIGSVSNSKMLRKIPVCAATEFKCDERCLPKEYQCNGVIECNDRTDEDNCPSRQGEFFVYFVLFSIIYLFNILLFLFIVLYCNNPIYCNLYPWFGQNMSTKQSKVRKWSQKTVEKVRKCIRSKICQLLRSYKCSSNHREKVFKFI